MTLQEDNHNCNYQHQETELKFLSDDAELEQKIEAAAAEAETEVVEEEP